MQESGSLSVETIGLVGDVGDGAVAQTGGHVVEAGVVEAGEFGDERGAHGSGCVAIA